MAIRREAKAIQHGDGGGGLLGPGDVVADAATEVCQTVRPQQEPELEGAESAPQGNRPLAVIDGLALTQSLEIIRTDAEGADLRLRVGEKLDRTVEMRAEPLVGIKDNTIGRVDTLP